MSQEATSAQPVTPPTPPPLAAPHPVLSRTPFFQFLRAAYESTQVGLVCMAFVSVKHRKLFAPVCVDIRGGPPGWAQDQAVSLLHHSACEEMESCAAVLMALPPPGVNKTKGCMRF